MALITTSWLMGSIPGVPETEIEVTANGSTETLTLPASDYYPWDGAAVNSALNQLHDALESHSQITSCSAFYGADRRPRFICDIAYSIDSWSDLQFRDLLGFSGGEAFSNTDQVPTHNSAYLWSPGRCEIPDAPLGANGLPYYDTARGMSGDLVTVATTNNSGSRNRFEWRRVFSERVMTSSLNNREYHAFWNAVVRQFANFKLYRNITEQDYGTDDTLTSLNGEVLGPYVWDNASGRIQLEYVREVERLELFNTITLPVLLADGY